MYRERGTPALAGPEGPGTKSLRQGQGGLLPDVLGDSSLMEEQLGHKWGQQLQGSLIRPQRAEYALPLPGAPKGGAKRDPRAASGSLPPTCFSQGSRGVTQEHRSQDIQHPGLDNAFNFRGRGKPRHWGQAAVCLPGLARVVQCQGCSPAPQEGLQRQSSKWVAGGSRPQRGLNSRHRPR